MGNTHTQQLVSIQEVDKLTNPARTNIIMCSCAKTNMDETVRCWHKKKQSKNKNIFWVRFLMERQIMWTDELQRESEVNLVDSKHENDFNLPRQNKELLLLHRCGLGMTKSNQQSAHCKLCRTLLSHNITPQTSFNTYDRIMSNSAVRDTKYSRELKTNPKLRRFFCIARHIYPLS